MEPDANALLKAAGAGDKAAAARLIALFYGRIYAFLRRLTSNDADADDLTQRACAGVWKSLPTFAGRSSVSSWIHSIAYHVYVDWRRNDRRAEPRTDEWWAARVAPGPGPDDLAARSDLAALVYSSVDLLEADLRETVHLHYYEGLTLQETADAMGTATSTVKYRLRQAVAKLQEEFAAERLPLKPL
jgi:RNA polymerase sigma-70 factor (ECF subfamily)